jgi:hypothetical protein
VAAAKLGPTPGRAETGRAARSRRATGYGLGQARGAQTHPDKTFIGGTSCQDAAALPALLPYVEGLDLDEDAALHDAEVRVFTMVNT